MRNCDELELDVTAEAVLARNRGGFRKWSLRGEDGGGDEDRDKADSEGGGTIFKDGDRLLGDSGSVGAEASAGEWRFALGINGENSCGNDAVRLRVWANAMLLVDTPATVLVKLSLRTGLAIPDASAGIGLGDNLDERMEVG